MLFWRNNFLLWVFCVFILYFIWTIFPDKYIEKWGVWKKYKRCLDHIGGCNWKRKVQSFYKLRINNCLSVTALAWYIYCLFVRLVAKNMYNCVWIDVNLCMEILGVMWTAEIWEFEIIEKVNVLAGPKPKHFLWFVSQPWWSTRHATSFLDREDFYTSRLLHQETFQLQQTNKRPYGKKSGVFSLRYS